MLSLFEQDWCICLAYEDKADDSDNTCGHARGIKHPSPCCTLSNPTTGKGPDDGTQEWRKAIYTDRLSALSWSPEIAFPD